MIGSNNQSAMSITKSVAAYSLLPGFWSRFVGFMPRFGMLAYLMAVIFESVKLLPKGHPFSDAKKNVQLSRTGCPSAGCQRIAWRI